MRSWRESRVQSLETALREAGLAGRVQVGVPLPVEPDPNGLPGGRAASPTQSAPRPESPGSSPEPVTAPLALDSLLSPRGSRKGRLIEVAGEPSSGRTALACRMAAATTLRGEFAGWVDLPNALDPRSLRRAGVEMRSLLWARPPAVAEALRCAELLLRTGFSLVVLDLQDVPPARLARLASPVWARLLRRSQEARGTVLALVPERVAGAFPTLGLWTERRRALFEGELFEGIEAHATVVRDRTGPIGTEHPFRVLQRPEGPPDPFRLHPAPITSVG